MANISEYLQSIKNAIYGEQVRDAIHDAINTINNESSLANENLITEYNNLLKPEGIIINHSSSGSITINNLTPGTAYYTNMTTDIVMAVYSLVDGSTIDIDVSYNNHYIYVDADNMLYDNLLFILYPGVDTSHLMLCENSLPDRYINNENNEYISKELISDLPTYDDIFRPNVVTIGSSVSMPIALSPTNTAYIIDITTNVIFNLPNYNVTTGQQILVHANVQTDVSISWGTIFFFNCDIPTVTIGTYDFIFEYADGNWYVGAVSKGAVS